MNTMKYNGYTAAIEYDDQDKLFVGRLSGIKDIVSFHGSSVSQLRARFREAVDGYIELSEQIGKSAQKPVPDNLGVAS